MDSLKIERRFNSPLIDFNSNNGLLKIIGRSIPENPVKFYQPLNDWVHNFIKTNPQDLIFYVHLDYLNTHSTECLLILMKKMENYYKTSGNNVKVSWNFDEYDEDMEGLGEDLASITEIPFEYKMVPEED